MEKCQCRPHYFPQYKDYGKCTFGVHANCISPSLNTFNFTKCVNCPVECEKNSYIRNVEYREYHGAIAGSLEKFVRETGNRNIEIAAIQVKWFIKILYLSTFQVYFPSLDISVHNQSGV